MEMMIIKQLLENQYKFEVKLPMSSYGINTGGLDLAKNYSTSGRTKHIAVRHHYLHELIAGGMIKM
jgi:hypothetical protein